MVSNFVMMKKDKKHETIHTVNVKCSITISPCPEISDEVISLLRAPGPVYTRHVRHVSAEISQYQGISPSHLPLCPVICSEFDKLFEFREMALAMRPEISILLLM